MLRRNASRRRGDEGFSLISLLIVVIILGVMMTLTIDSLDGTGLPSSPSNATTTLPSTPSGANTVITQAQVAACKADFSTIETALVTYLSDNGRPPGAGTTWATSNPNGAPILSAWPSGAPNFTFAWNGTNLEVIPAHGNASYDSLGTSSPPTGCYAP